MFNLSEIFSVEIGNHLIGILCITNLVMKCVCSLKTYFYSTEMKLKNQLQIVCEMQVYNITSLYSYLRLFIF